MSGQAMQTEATTDRIPEASARAILRALASADAAIRSHPEPRMGPAFDAKNLAWTRIYDKALTLGAEIEAEDQ